jgi:hypothetical protein
MARARPPVPHQCYVRVFPALYAGGHANVVFTVKRRLASPLDMARPAPWLQLIKLSGLEDLVLQSATLTLADMQKTILDGVTARSHGPLADDVSLVIAEVR